MDLNMGFFDNIFNSLSNDINNNKIRDYYYSLLDEYYSEGSAIEYTAEAFDISEAEVYNIIRRKSNYTEWLDNSHYQSYIVINLCRILYTVIHGVTGTKKTSAEWVKKRFGLPWSNLIEHAAYWEYGKKLLLKSETINFIKFCVNEIKQTEIYKQMLSNNSERSLCPRIG